MRKAPVLILVIAVLLYPLCLSSYAADYGTPQRLHQIPWEAQEEDVSIPNQVIGTGTPESCTEEAFREAVAQGGTIVFNGGNEPFTLTLTEPAKVFNDGLPDVVIDGGGLVTLDGGGITRILYMNTCDPNQVWTTSHCNNQSTPRLTVQNITFANGNAENETTYSGGGAIFVRGGQFKIVNCRFINNRCAAAGPDVGGGAVRVFDQYNDLPVYVVNSTFGGEPGLGNIGSNGGAISSIGVSWTIINSVFSYNEAVGNGGNPAKNGTPGGGSGGAIYSDGNEMTLTLLGSSITNNKVNAYGSGIFFVTNNHTGNIVMDNTTVDDNIGGSWYPVYEGISMHSDTAVSVTFSEKEGYKTSNETAVIVDGQEVAVSAYNFFGYNYYRLRDIAEILAESEKPFDVGWDASESIVILNSGEPYAIQSSEAENSITKSSVYYQKNEPSILMNGKRLEMGTYLINGYNYFRLRDLSELVGFDVSWDSETEKIAIGTE